MQGEYELGLNSAITSRSSAKRPRHPSLTRGAIDQWRAARPPHAPGRGHSNSSVSSFAGLLASYCISGSVRLHGLSAAVLARASARFARLRGAAGLLCC